MKKKLLSILLAATMVAATGCGQESAADALGETKEESGTGQTQEASDEKESSAEEENTGEESPAGNSQPQELDTSERVDLVVFQLGDPPGAKEEVLDKINGILLEKVNATIDFQFTTWTDWQQKYSLQLTTGGVDLVYTANWSEYGTFASSGAFLPLDDLLDTVSPDLRELLGEGALNQCRVGGELYTIPSNMLDYSCNGLLYREDLREKYDLPVPNTLENLEAYLAGIQENDPDQGLVDVNSQDSIAQIFNLKYPWVTFAGLPYGLSINYNTPSQIDDYWFSDDFVDDMKLLKKWVEMGFWSRSALSNTPQDSPFENGMCVISCSGYNPGKAVGCQQTLAKEHPDWKAEFIAFGETNGVIYAANRQSNGTAISKDCKYPERAMKVLELLMTDEELNRLVTYGIEGEHYELDEDGYYQNISDEFTIQGFNTWNLLNADTELPSERSLMLNEMYAKFEALAAKTKYPNTDIFGGFVADNAEYSTEDSAVANVVSQYLPPLQAGTVEDVDAVIAEFREKVMEAGLEKCREGYKEQWLAYCEEYGYK